MKNSRSGEKIKLTSIDELLGIVNEESAMEIEIKAISPFKGHPFKVIADDKMEVLINSVKESGVITPVLFRPSGENHYEMYPVIGECMRHVKQDFLQCGTRRGPVARPLREGGMEISGASFPGERRGGVVHKIAK